MYMNVHEFRTNLKTHLDSALSGQDVLIERGGVSYRLICDLRGPLPTANTPKDSVTPLKIKTPADIPKVLENLKCKGTHYLDRTDCGKLECPWGVQ